MDLFRYCHINSEVAVHGVSLANEVEEVAARGVAAHVREVRRLVPSPPYDFLRLTPDLLVLRNSRCLLRIVVDRQHRARD
jgi:hypothetical protein